MTDRLLALCVLVPFLAVGTEFHVNNQTGSDAADGLSPEKAFATLARATKELRAGDVLVIAPGKTYGESLVLKRGGTADRPIVIRGNGAVISGLKPIPKDAWSDRGNGLFLNANKLCWGALRPRVFLGEGRMLSVVCGHFKNVTPESLKPLQAIWNEEGIWFRAEAGKSAADYDLRGTYAMGGHSGVMIESCDYITVEDLTAQCFPNDGFNVHGSCHGLVFRNIVGRWNGDDGFSVHEDVQANVYHANLHHNDFGIQDINASQTSFFGCTVVSNRLCGVDMYGGMRIFHDVTVRDNGGNQVCASRGDAEQLRFVKGNPMLDGLVYMRNSRIGPGSGDGLRIGADARMTAVGTTISGVETGVRVNGNLHLVSSRICGCTSAAVRKAGGASFITRNCTVLLPFGERLNAEIERVSRQGGGRVVVPAGTNETGTVVLKSNVELHLEDGAVLLGSSEFDAYPLRRTFRTRSQKDVNGWCALIYAEGATNVSVTGRGIIDGRGAAQPARVRVPNVPHDLDGRARGLLFASCRGVTVRDVRIRNPAMWTQHYFDCEDVRIEGIDVFARANYNNDGIDIDSCRRVTIRNCTIDSADDAIVLKTTATVPCEDVMVENCRLATQASGFKLGTETLAGMRRVTAHDLTICASEGGTGFDHPGWRGRAISALEAMTVDGGTVEDVHIENVVAERVESPVFIRVGNRARPPYPGIAGLPAGSLRNVRIVGLTCRDAGACGSSVTAFEPGRIQGVVLERVRIAAAGGVRAGGWMTDAQCAAIERDFPSPSCFGGKLPAKGLYVSHAADVAIRDFSVTTYQEDERPVEVRVE